MRRKPFPNIFISVHKGEGSARKGRGVSTHSTAEGKKRVKGVDLLGLYPEDRGGEGKKKEK